MKPDEIKRVQAKTAEQRFLNVMTQEFNHAPRVAQAIFAEAQACLLGQAQNLRPGQTRKILLKREAAHGQDLSQSETIEVTWTLDAREIITNAIAKNGQANVILSTGNSI